MMTGGMLKENLRFRVNGRGEGLPAVFLTVWERKGHESLVAIPSLYRAGLPTVFWVGLCLLTVLLTASFSPNAESGETSTLESDWLGLKPQSDESLKVLYSGTDRVELLLLTPRFSSEPIYAMGPTPGPSQEGREFQILSIKGYGCLLEEGKPQLPMKSVLLATPEGAEVTVEIAESEVLSFSGLSVYPLPIDYSSENGLDYRETQFHPARGEALALNSIQKSVDSFYPGKIAEIGISGYLRDARVVQLCIYPVQYNSFRKEVKLYTKLHLTVKFVYKSKGINSSSFRAPSSSTSLKTETSDVANGSGTTKEWDQIYNHTIANYQSLRNSDFGIRNSDLDPTFSKSLDSAFSFPHSEVEGQAFHSSIPFTAPHLQPQTKYKLIIAQDGIYRLTHQNFLDAGIDVSSINLKTLKLTNKDKAVPLFVSGENDGKFDKEDYLEFYGEFNRGKYSLYGEYTKENVYWLSWGQENGARMVLLDGGGGGVEDSKARTPLSYQVVDHFEEDKFRGGLGYVDEKRDFWFWGNATGKQTLKYPFELHNVINTAECKVRVMLHGLSVLEHHTRILLNGVELFDDIWNGQREYLYESPPLKSTLLKNGENILVFASVGDTPAGQADVVYFNWFEIEYSRSLIAVNDILAFEIEESGAYQFKLAGFSSKSIEVYKGKTCKFQNYKIFREGDAYSLTFFDEIVTPTKYLAICTQRKNKPVLNKSNKNAQVMTLLVKDEPLEGDYTPQLLRSPSNSADYIIIVYDDFYDDVLPLAKHRSNQFRTMVVRVSDIYDEFSYGLLSPEAIRDFLRYAYHYWQKPSPTYVLLVGDATWNFKHGKNYVPAYYFQSLKMGQAATDNLYACVNGDDPLPDLFIGRIPTRTKENTRAVVEKIIRYEQTPNFGVWRRRLLMLAGAAGSFEGDTEQLIADYISPESGYEVMRVYTNPKSKYYGKTEQLLDFWNAGCSFIHFTGHGGGNIWSDEALFTLNDVQFLTNESMPAFVTSFTCYTSHFDDPYQNCLNELFVTKEEGGAIASLGSTGLGWATGDYYMEQALFESLFALGTRRLGEAILEAKVILMINHRSYTDIVNLYNLLGDAAVNIPLPQEKIDMTASLSRDKQLEVRGIVGKMDESSYQSGSALLEVDSQVEPTTPLPPFFKGDDKVGDDTLEFQDTELNIKDGRFDLTIKPVRAPQKVQAGRELLIRCYACLCYGRQAWDDDKMVSRDAAGAVLLKIAGQDDVDLSVFSDDITFTTLEDASARSQPKNWDDKNNVKLQATVYNLGQKQASSVLVYFYAGNPFSGGFKIGEVVIPQIDGLRKAKAEIEWRTDVEKQTIHCHVDPKNEIHELNEANNTAENTLIFSSYIITPEDGSAGEITSSDGNLTIKIEKGAVLEAVTLSVESENSLPLIMQPQLQYLPLPSTHPYPSKGGEKGCAYRLRMTKDNGEKEDVLAPQAVISLTFRYDEEIEDVGIFKYRDDLKQWEIALRKEEQEVDKQAVVHEVTAERSEHTISATVPLTQQFFDGLLFTLMVSADGTPPLIQLSIADERLPYDGFYASETPTISATVSDANGVGKILFFLNEKQIDDSELVSSHGLNNVAVTSFSPTLKAGNYRCKVKAFDLCGNVNEETLSFSVGGKMKLLKVSNHPNPFKNETYFTYVLLDEAEYVTIKIYTTSGRLIAQLDAPARLGYNEILWDGKDKDGESIANGVYFYKITVKTEKERLSHVGKLLVQG
jgi:hypothetical protein